MIIISLFKEKLSYVVDDAARDVIPYERDLYSKIDEQRLRQLIEKGAKVTYQDRAAFIEASKIVYDKWEDKIGGKEKVKAILDFEY